MPLDWRTDIVRPIFKNGDKFDASNYKPISFTSIVVKVMESVIYDKMVQFLLDKLFNPIEANELLPGKSVQTNFLCYLYEWKKELDMENTIDVLYLDFSKAFDRVPRYRLLLKLRHLGIRGNLLA